MEIAKNSAEKDKEKAKTDAAATIKNLIEKTEDLTKAATAAATDAKSAANVAKVAADKLDQDAALSEIGETAVKGFCQAYLSQKGAQADKDTLTACLEALSGS